MSTSTCSIIRLVRAYGDGGSRPSSSVTSKSWSVPVSGSLVAYSEAEEENSTRCLPSAVELVEELERLGDVVAVVLVRLLDRLRHHDPRGHVDGRVEVGVLGDDPAQQRAVGDVALVEHPVAHERQRSGEQRVEDHRRVPGLLEGLRGDRADVAGAAGDENLHGAHPRSRPVRPPTAGRWHNAPHAERTHHRDHRPGRPLSRRAAARQGVRRPRPDPGPEQPEARPGAEPAARRTAAHRRPHRHVQPDPGAARQRPRRGLQPRRDLVRRLLVGERHADHRRDRQGRAHHARVGPAARRATSPGGCASTRRRARRCSARCRRPRSASRPCCGRARRTAWRRSSATT